MVLEVENLTSIADYFIFASGDSERQVRGLAAFIEKEVMPNDITPIRSLKARIRRTGSYWIMATSSSIFSEPTSDSFMP